VKPNNN